MKILGIETATSVCAVGIADASGFVAEYKLHQAHSHAEFLPEAVRKIMEDSGVEPAGLNGIAISIGPGSFTGLRIGLAFAKGLAFGWKLPLIPVSTMAGLVSQIPPVVENVCVLIVARRDEVYQGCYQWNERWEPDGSIHTVAGQDIGKNMTGECLFVGDGAKVFHDMIVRNHPKPHFLAGSFSLPGGYGIAEEGGRVLESGRIPDADTLVPYYIKRFQGIA